MKNRYQKNKEKDHISQLKKQHRKIFFANLKEVCNLLAGYDLYSKFPVAFIEKIYKHRLHEIGTVFDDQVMSRSEFDKFSEYLIAAIQAYSLDLLHNKSKVGLSLMLIEGHSLTIQAKNLKDDEFPAARETREVLKDYMEEDRYGYFTISVQQMLFVHGVMLSKVDYGFVWTLLNVEPTKSKTAIHYSFVFDKVAPVKENFIIDGHARPAYRVGWAFPISGMVWAEIKPLQKGLTEEQPIPVFIQAHALQRMGERMDVPPGPLQYALHESIKSLNYHEDKNGKILIDFIYNQKKTGYLVASVVNNRLLIHTFLFLTNSGTPEGQKLFELTGLQSLDKKYLAIDKLSTFLSYKINDNEFVKNIFVQAGCGHLLDLEDSSRLLFKPVKEMSADTIARYLMAQIASR